MGGTLDQLKSKVPLQSGQVFFGGADHLKSKVPTSLTIFMGGYSGHRIPEILEWGHSKNFEHKILAAQILSHTLDLRVWRLMSITSHNMNQDKYILHCIPQGNKIKLNEMYLILL